MADWVLCCDVRRHIQTVVYKSWRESFQSLDLLQENVWPLIIQYNIRLLIDQWESRSKP